MSTWLADRPGHGSVVVSGPDATSFLQSLLSQDLDAVDAGAGCRSLLLTPQGKLGVTLRVLRVRPVDGDDQWWLDTEAGFGEELATMLGRYRIRVDAEIRDRTEAWGLLEVRGHEAVARVAAAAKVDVPEVDGSHVPWGELRVVRADWPDREGVDVVGPTEAVRAARDELLHDGVDPVAPGEYDVARIVAGVPRLGVDVDERTIPQEAFLERDSVSFTKGCFVGQELVCRIDTRGHVNRHLRLLRIAGDVVPEAGATVAVDDTDVGVVTSAARVPGEHRVVAMAMLRREVEPPAPAVIRAGTGGTGGTDGDGTDLPATVEALPGTS
jgi:folate-binding protein YgfZ